MDKLQQPISESSQGNSLNSTSVFSPTSIKSNKRLWILAGVVIGVLCCFSIICLAIVEPLIFGAGMDAIENISTNIETETAPIESVLDSYMKYMLEKDTENAYALFSPRAQRQIKISKLQELLDNNY